MSAGAPTCALAECQAPPVPGSKFCDNPRHAETDRKRRQRSDRREREQTWEAAGDVLCCKCRKKLAGYRRDELRAAKVEVQNATCAAHDPPTTVAAHPQRPQSDTTKLRAAARRWGIYVPREAGRTLIEQRGLESARRWLRRADEAQRRHQGGLVSQLRGDITRLADDRRQARERAWRFSIAEAREKARALDGDLMQKWVELRRALAGNAQIIPLPQRRKADQERRAA